MLSPLVNAGRGSMATAETGGRRRSSSRSVRQDLRHPIAAPAAAVEGEGRAGPIDLLLDESCTEARGVDSTTMGDPLVVVYWNVAGIAAANIDYFLLDMENEVLWDVLILLEFSAARQELNLSGVRSTGHLVCSQPYSSGRRAGALVFHSRLRIHHVELISHGRAFGADFRWGGWNIRVVGGHADAAGDRRPYQKVSTIWSISLKLLHVIIS